MSVVFPLSPAPSGFTSCTWSKQNGIYYPGDTVSCTLTVAGATGYSVRDITGTVVSSGTVSGTTVTPAPPAGGWQLGWYRLYLTGSNTDALFGTSLGASMFSVIRVDSHFPDIPVTTAGKHAFRDLPLRGCLGIGTSRLQIDSPPAPNTGNNTLSNVRADLQTAKDYWSVPTLPANVDSARPRSLWTNFVAATYDFVTSGGLRIYPKDGTLDGSTITIVSEAGSTSGTKLRVVVGGSTVETYDNLATADAAVTATVASTRIKCFGNGTFPTGTNAVIGRSAYTGVGTVVTALYPDVPRFEGPSNEPNLNAGGGTQGAIEVVHQQRLFYAAVKAANPAAIVLGPCPIDVNNITGWATFLANGGASFCDEISFHAYNSNTNGDLNQGRAILSAFTALLAANGISKPLWNTESNNVFTCVYGVHHPRRSRVILQTTLLFEQYGIPRERNSTWYDIGHGFWTYPSWLENQDGSVAPWAALLRTLAMETFGMTHQASLSFGPVADRIYLSSRYQASDGSACIVVQPTSAIPSGYTTFSVTGATSLTMSDGWGNTSVLPVTNGRVNLPASEFGSYLRVPAGVTVTPYSVNGWPQDAVQPSSARRAGVATIGSLTTGLPIDGAWPTGYNGTTSSVNGSSYSSNSLPDTATILFPDAQLIDRVVVWFGQAWQAASTATDFDLQTTVDGTTWVTQTTVTLSPSSFLHGSNSLNTGTQRETFWDEQWIHDLPVPLQSVKGVRLFVRATSYGGEPDAACVTTGGQGASPGLVVQEIVTLCGRNASPWYVTH